MRKILALLLFVGVFFLTNLIYASEKTKSTMKIDVARQWLSAGNDVVKRTKNNDAAVIMRYLQDSFHLNNLTFSDEGLATQVLKNAREHPICIETLLLDSSEKKTAKRLLDNQFSEVWKGLILIYEGGLALGNVGGAYDEIKDPAERGAVAAFCAYQLETVLLEKIGGKAYHDLIEIEVKRLNGYCLGKEHIILDPDYTLYHGRLEKIFGKSNSKLEANVRGSAFWINSVFHLIDWKFKVQDERDEQKVLFIKQLFQKG